jgi:hypothetical protein
MNWVWRAWSRKGRPRRGGFESYALPPFRDRRNARRASRGLAPGMLVSLTWVLVVLSGPSRLAAAELKPKTVQAFDQYVQKAELRTDRGLEADGAFLWIDSLPSADRSAAYARLRKGEILVHSFAAGLDVPGGMIHDWVGVVLVPGASLDEVLAQIQDYDAYARIYAPEIVRSKLLKRDGDDYQVSLWLQKKSLVDVVFDLDENVQYLRISPSRAYSRAQSTRIAEIEDYGTPQEHEAAAGTGHGYVWKIRDFSRFLQRPEGVYLQFEIIALSRNIPWGLGWLIKPFVAQIPREELRFTLGRTRDRVEASMSSPQQAVR